MPSPFHLAINGYGRIGRCFLRALRESPVPRNLQVVAINEPAGLESMAYLTRFDSTHGRFPGEVETDNDKLLIDGQALAVRHAQAPEDLAIVTYSSIIGYVIPLIAVVVGIVVLDEKLQAGIVAGGILFALTMVLTYAIGCWITAVMRGPRRDGDVFPSGQGRPAQDD